MIHLITLNPAIDNYIEIDNIDLNKTNYSNSQYMNFGGKACNVAQVLNEFTSDYQLVTTTSDDFNDFISNQLNGINKHLIKSTSVRINTKIKSNNEITEINSTGESLSEQSRNSFIEYIENNVKNGDHVLVAGNPNPDDFTFMIELCLKIKGITDYLYVDSSKLTLSDLQKIKPYYIKPNLDELSFLLNKEVTTSSLLSDIKPLYNYIENIMVSLGIDGIYYGNINAHVFTKPIIGEVINTVGAGDSCVAGSIYAITNDYSLQQTANLAAACGSATAFSSNLAIKDEINKLLKNLS